MTLAEGFGKPSKGQKGGDLPAQQAKEKAEADAYSAAVAAHRALTAPFTLKVGQFKGKNAQAEEARGGPGYDLFINFGGASGEVCVARSLSAEKVAEVREAGSLEPVKPKAFEGGPA